jgi:hypothetical protein
MGWKWAAKRKVLPVYGCGFSGAMLEVSRLDKRG